MVKENPRIMALRARRKRRLEKRAKDLQKREEEEEEQQQQLNLSPSHPLSSLIPLKRRSPLSSSSSPSPTKFSLSSPEPTSKKRQSFDSLSGQPSFSDLRALPPLPPPPPPSPKLLRRAISDPAHLTLPVSDTEGLRRVSKNLGQTHQVFDENPYQNGHGSASKPTQKDDEGGERKMIRYRAVGAERMEGDWTMIKINCPCGSDYQLLVSEVEKKCYYKLV